MDDTFLSLPNLEPGGPDAPMPAAPALGAQYYNTTPRRRPKAVKAARARDDFDIFDLDQELLADFVAPCHPPKPQPEQQAAASADAHFALYFSKC